MAWDAYEIWLTTDTGMRVTLLDNITSLSAGRAVNRIGRLEIGLPESFDTSLIKPDYIVQVWRAGEGGRLSLWRPYFIRRWRYETRGAAQMLTVWGADANDLLRRRIVAGYAGTANTSKTAVEADDMMKDIVTDAMSDAIAPVPDAGSRAWGSLSVQADLTAGPQLTKGFAWQQLLYPGGGGLLPIIGEAAREAGTEVFFDIVVSNVGGDSISLEFRTYTGQPGVDRTRLGVVFDQERGNLADPFLEYDYTEEQNYIYACGQGYDAGRDVQQVYDTASINISQWNRCEGYANASFEAAANAVREAGRARLAERRPRRRFGGRPIDTAGTRFGRDWDQGDKVTARYRGFEFEAIIRATQIRVDGDGEETITARLEHEE